jgi:hypothetical protein
LELGKISLSDLTNLFVSDLNSLKLNRKVLKEIVLSDYDISQKDYNDKISSKVDELDSSDFSDLKKSRKKREELLKKILLEIPLQREKVSVFEKIL